MFPVSPQLVTCGSTWTAIECKHGMHHIVIVHKCTVDKLLIKWIRAEYDTASHEACTGGEVHSNHVSHYHGEGVDGI